MKMNTRNKVYIIIFILNCVISYFLPISKESIALVFFHAIFCVIVTTISLYSKTKKSDITLFEKAILIFIYVHLPVVIGSYAKIGRYGYSVINDFVSSYLCFSFMILAIPDLIINIDNKTPTYASKLILKIK